MFYKPKPESFMGVKIPVVHISWTLYSEVMAIAQPPRPKSSRCGYHVCSTDAPCSYGGGGGGGGGGGVRIHVE